MPITTHAQLDWPTFKQFVNHQYFGNIRVRISYAIAILMLVGGIIGHFMNWLTLPLSWIIAIALVSLSMLILMPLLLQFATKKNFEQQTQLHPPSTYLFDQKGFTNTGQGFQTKMAWTQVHRIEETKDLFLIFHNKQMANIIPKKDMDAGSINGLRALVNSIEELNSKLLA